MNSAKENLQIEYINKLFIHENQHSNFLFFLTQFSC